MLDFHKKNNAEATISVIDVPYEEASQIWNNECQRRRKDI